MKRDITIHNTMNILLVDDKSENLLALESILDDMDCMLFNALSGLEALGLLLKYNFALALVDVQMPDMNGFELAELIRGRQDTRHLPIIFVTAISKEPRHVFKGYDVGAVDYLFKPFEPEILRSKVKIFLELYGQRQLLTIQALELKAKTQELEMEILERQRAEEQIRVSLQEKEMLLKEIHHRVKNNLQIISSLLNLQTHMLQDHQAQTIFQESQQRIKSMALIHEKLYRSEDLANIDFKEYITALIRDLSRSYYSSTQTVQWRIDVTDVHFGIDTAIPCGLIVNELISNALKYAFPEGTGAIRVHLSQIPDGRYELIVNDDGIGLPEEFSMDHLDSLGLQLVQGLAKEQLNGEFEVTSQLGNGTTWRIVFP